MSESIDAVLINAAKEIVEKSGYSLVDCNLQHLKGGRLKAQVVIFSPEGTGVDDCSRVHKVLFPRMEMLAEEFDFYLEIASPGIDRVFKNNEEFGVFKGQKVKVLLDNESEWISGEILSYENSVVTLKHNDETEELSVSDIRKAKLDY